MLLESGLIEIEPLTNSGQGGFVEIFKSPTSQDWANGLDELDLVDYSADEDGSGLILFVYKGKRNWIKTSVSKTPFTFLKKALATLEPAYFDSVILIRGAAGYPLSDKEIKHLSARLNTRLKDTGTHFISSYVSLIEENDKAVYNILDNALSDVIEILTYNDLDTVKKVRPPEEPKEASELQSGTSLVVVNGLDVVVQTKLVDENNPEAGLDYVSIRVSSPEGKSIVYASTGLLHALEDEI